ncbi:hypothetical protein [Pseudoalteromonas phage PH357]|nr:hypothetical protein [Pseudoalteromonas phage PH357]
MIDREWQEDNVDLMVNCSLNYWLGFEEYKCCEKVLRDLRKGFVKEYGIVCKSIDDELDLEEIPFLLIKDTLPNGDYILEWDWEAVRFEYD